MKKSTKLLSIALMLFGFGAFAQAPTANFSWTPTTPCATKTVQVTDQSTASPTAWVYIVSGANTGTFFVQNPVVTFTAPGTQTITLICANGTGTSIPVSKTITVLPNPTVTTSSSNSLSCPGNSVTLQAGGAVTYSWAAPVSSSLAAVVVSPTITVTYSVTGTGTNGCSWTQTITQNVASISVASTTNNLCSGSTATLTASGAASYSWAPGGQTNNTITVTPTVTSTYTITNSTCSLTAMFTQSVQNCATGIQKNATSGISFNLYPNPTNGDFTIELNNGTVKTIEILDMTGRMVYSNTTSSDKVNCNLSALAKGIYYVRVQSNNSIEVAKIVKQ